MKRFDFEYDNDNLKLKLFIISIILFLGVFFVNIYFNILNFFSSFLISTLIVFLILFFNKKKIKRIGIAEINNEKISFNLNGMEQIINFYEIENYTLYSFKNGISLNLKLKKGTKFGILSNSYFSNPSNFINVCNEFEKKIKNYRKEKNIDLVTEKRFIDKYWVFPFLLIITIVIMIILVILISKNNDKTASFFGVIGSLMTIWSLYIRDKNKPDRSDM